MPVLDQENETSAARVASEQARFQVFAMQKDEQVLFLSYSTRTYNGGM